MNKKLDMPTLPDGFLIEWPHDNENAGWSGTYIPMNDGIREYDGYRPALNHWHFNDGSMVIPDGLVVDIWFADGHTEVNNFENSMYSFQHEKTAYSLDEDTITPCTIIAIKILGVHPDYELDGKRLGLAVVEL